MSFANESKTPRSGWNAGDIVDAGDHLEIPLVEEVLVKVPVVREVVRVRKDSVLGKALVRGEVRKEDVVAERRPPPGPDAADGSDVRRDPGGGP